MGSRARSPLVNQFLEVMEAVARSLELSEHDTNLSVVLPSAFKKLVSRKTLKLSPPAGKGRGKEKKID